MTTLFLAMVAFVLAAPYSYAAPIPAVSFNSPGSLVYGICDELDPTERCSFWHDPNNVAYRPDFQVHVGQTVNIPLVTFRSVTVEKYENNATYFTQIITDPLYTVTIGQGEGSYSQYHTNNRMKSNWTWLDVAFPTSFSTSQNLGVSGLKISTNTTNLTPYAFSVAGTVKGQSLGLQRYEITATNPGGGLLDFQYTLTVKTGLNATDSFATKFDWDPNDDWGSVDFSGQNGGFSQVAHTFTDVPAGFTIDFDEVTEVLTIPQSVPPGNYTLNYSVVGLPSAGVEGNQTITTELAFQLNGSGIEPLSLELEDAYHLFLTKSADFQYNGSATGGAVSVDYSIEVYENGQLSALPDNIVFDQNTGQLSGSPQHTGEWNISITAIDLHRTSLTESFNLSIDVGYPLGLIEVADQQLILGEDFLFQLGVLAGEPGDAPLSYSLEQKISSQYSPVANWVVFDENDLTVSGTPSEFGTFEFRLTVTDGFVDPESESVEFVLEVADDTQPVFSQSFGTVYLHEATMVNLTIDVAQPSSGEANAPYEYEVFVLAGEQEVSVPAWLNYTATDERFIFNQTTVAFSNSSADFTQLRVRVTDLDGDTLTLSVDLQVFIDTTPSFNSAADNLSGFRFNPLTIPLPSVVEDVGNGPYVTTLLLANGSALPDGLAIVDGSLQGTPLEEGNYTLTLTVTDVQTQSTSLDFNLFINTDPDVPLMSPLADIAHIIGYDEDIYILPEVYGGDGVLEFVLSVQQKGEASFLPEGLVFSSINGSIAGAPTVAGEWDVNILVRDEENNATDSTFNLFVEDDTVPELSSQGGLELQTVSGFSINHTLTLGAGFNAPIKQSYLQWLVGGNYSALPADATFDNTTLLLQLPSRDAQTLDQYQWTVTDANGNTSTLTFSVDWLTNTNPIFNASQYDETYLNFEGVDLALTFDLAASDRDLKNLPYNYSIYLIDAENAQHPLPAWLTFQVHESSLSLSGLIPDFSNSSEDNITLGIIVTDTEGDSSSVNFTLSTAKDTAPSFVGLVETIEVPQFSQLNLDAFPLAHEDLGNAPYSYALTIDGADGLPANLVYDDSSRILSGKISESGTFNLVYTATDAQGDSSTLSFMLNVEPSSILAFEQLNASHLLLQGSTINITLPTAVNAAGQVIYSLSNEPLPQGVNFENNTLIGTVDSKAVVGLYNLTLTATNEPNLPADLSIYLTVEAPQAPTGNTTITEQSAYAGEGAINVNLSALVADQSGNGELEYSFSFELDEVSEEGLPAGISFNDETMQLVGIPTVFGNFTITMVVSDSDDDHSLEDSHTATFSLTLLEALAFVDSPAPLVEFVGRAISTSLPEAIGGTPGYSYAILETLPVGVTFDNQTRLLSGSPEQVGNYQLTYEVTDAENRVFSSSFSIQVGILEATFAQAVKDLSYQFGEPVSVQLPLVNQEDSMPYSYELSAPLPEGLSYNEGNRTLFGLATDLGSFTLTYSATAFGETTSQSFQLDIQADTRVVGEILGRHALLLASATGQTVKDRLAKVSQAARTPYSRSSRRHRRSQAVNIKSGGLNYGVWLDSKSLTVDGGDDSGADTSWSGKTSLSQLGFELASATYFGGVIIESASSTTDYSQDYSQGKLDLNVDYTTLFGGYKKNKLTFWGATSSGSGDASLTLTAQSESLKLSGDVTYSALIIGGTYQSSQTLNYGFGLTSGAKLSVSGDLAEDGSGGSIKLYGDWTPVIAGFQAGTDKLAILPKVSVGFRSDSGDYSASGLDIVAGATMHLKAFSLGLGLKSFSAGEYSESGNWFSASWNTAGPGLSASFRASQGNIASSRSTLFQAQNLHSTVLESSSDDRNAHLELGYGVQWSNKDLAFYLSDDSPEALFAVPSSLKYGASITQGELWKLSIEQAVDSERTLSVIGSIKVY